MLLCTIGDYKVTYMVLDSHVFWTKRCGFDCNGSVYLPGIVYNWTANDNPLPTVLLGLKNMFKGTVLTIEGKQKVQKNLMNIVVPEGDNLCMYIEGAIMRTCINYGPLKLLKCLPKDTSRVIYMLRCLESYMDTHVPKHPSADFIYLHLRDHKYMYDKVTVSAVKNVRLVPSLKVMARVCVLEKNIKPSNGMSIPKLLLK